MSPAKKFLVKGGGNPAGVHTVEDADSSVRTYFKRSVTSRKWSTTFKVGGDAIEEAQISCGFRLPIAEP